MQKRLRYALAFKDWHGIYFVKIRMTGFPEDMMHPKLLSVNCKRPTYAALELAKVMRNHQGVLRLLFRLRKDVPVTKAVLITDNWDRGLYLYSENHVLLLTQAAVAFVKSDGNAAPFRSISC